MDSEEDLAALSLVFTVALGAAAYTVFMYSLLPPHAIPFVQGKTVDLAWIEGSVPAGFPSPAADFAQKRQDFNDLLVVHPAATFMWQARGVSMIEFGISDGDILVVDRRDWIGLAGEWRPSGSITCSTMARPGRIS